MKLTVVGCAGTFPGPTSPCSAYLVEQDGFKLLLDMGNGSLGALQRCAGLLDLDAVVISHHHADHCLDLVPYTYVRRYHPDGEQSALGVFGPTGLRERICNAFEAPPADMLNSVYDFYDTPAGTEHRVGPFTLTYARTNHPIECYAVRVAAGGRSLTYSADTGVSGAVADLAADTDLFLCEASFRDDSPNPSDVHLTGRPAGEHADRAQAKSLVLTHLVAWGDDARSLAEAKSTYSGPIDLARSCATYDI